VSTREAIDLGPFEQMLRAAEGELCGIFYLVILDGNTLRMCNFVSIWLRKTLYSSGKVWITLIFNRFNRVALELPALALHINQTS
jgi:hypothetical protein